MELIALLKIIQREKCFIKPLIFWLTMYAIVVNITMICAKEHGNTATWSMSGENLKCDTETLDHWSNAKQGPTKQKCL